MKIRDLFSGDPIENPTIQEVAGRQKEDIETARTEAEDDLRSVMPGDDAEGHPLRSDPVEYMDVPYSELRSRLEAGGMDLDEERKVRRALAYQEKFHAEGITRIR